MDDVDRNKITSAACVHGQGQDEDQFQPIRANDRQNWPITGWETSFNIIPFDGTHFIR